MISLEFTTKSGSVYVADVVNKRIKRTRGTGTNRIQNDWKDYQELIGGAVGQPLKIYWGSGKDEFSDKADKIGNQNAPEADIRRHTVTSLVVELKHLNTETPA